MSTLATVIDKECFRVHSTLHMVLNSRHHLLSFRSASATPPKTLHHLVFCCQQMHHATKKKEGRKEDRWLLQNSERVSGHREPLLAHEMPFSSFPVCCMQICQIVSPSQPTDFLTRLPHHAIRAIYHPTPRPPPPQKHLKCVPQPISLV